jgi:hypothetical protein
MEVDSASTAEAFSSRFVLPLVARTPETSEGGSFSIFLRDAACIDSRIATVGSAEYDSSSRAADVDVAASHSPQDLLPRRTRR